MKFGGIYESPCPFCSFIEVIRPYRDDYRSLGDRILGVASFMGSRGWNPGRVLAILG